MPLLSLNELKQISPVFRGNAGSAFGKSLMHILSIDKINDLYDSHSFLNGPDFAASVLEDVGFEYRIGFPDIMSTYGDNSMEILDSIIPDGPFITVSNHPCGHLDGVALVDIFGHLRPDYKVMVNQILARIKPLEKNFISVTPVGNVRTVPTSASIRGVKDALIHLHNGGALGLFPSGAVSDLSLRDRSVRDREWQEAIIKLIIKAQVPILPVRFFGGNSLFYYLLGLIDWRVRLLRLPAEVFNKKGRPMYIGIGNLISVEEQRCLWNDADTFRDFLRTSVYGMTYVR